MQETLLRSIYREYSQSLYNFVLWMTSGDKLESDDILQKVFIKIWNVKEAPAELGALKSWLFTIARNTCLDHFRAHSRKVRLKERLANETIRYSEPNVGKSMIWKCLDVLNETDRSILYLHIKAGYSYKEIGKMHNLSENNVRIRAFRALKVLRKNQQGETA